MYLPKETKIMKNLLGRFGCMSRTQFIYILKYGAGFTDAAINVVIEGLKVRNEMIEITENMFIPSHQGKVERSKICLLWVLIREVIDSTLDRCESDGTKVPFEQIMSDLDSTYPARSPIDFTYLNEGKSFDITYLDYSSLNKAAFIERTLEKFRIHKDEPEVYLTSEIFIFERTGNRERDELIVEELHNMNLEIPYDVYLVEMGTSLENVPELLLMKHSAMR